MAKRFRSFLFGAKASDNLAAVFAFKLNEENNLEPCSVGVYATKMMTFAALGKAAL